jgi:hypothetical protein
VGGRGVGWESASSAECSPSGAGSWLRERERARARERETGSFIRNYPERGFYVF